MIKFTSNSDFIKSFYKKYNFNSPVSVPSFAEYLDPNMKVIFNNESFEPIEIPGLIKTFFTNMYSIKIDIVGDIKCLNKEEGIYLVLSNWYCKTIKGTEGMCPMIEIMTIKDFKIVDAIAIMDTTEIGKF
jgi:hypothetical protein